MRSSDRLGGDAALGLAIVRGIVEAHAGRVWLEDSPDGIAAVLACSLPAASRRPA
jgi:signal transduction histidine kinase